MSAPTVLGQQSFPITVYNGGSGSITVPTGTELMLVMSQGWPVTPPTQPTDATFNTSETLIGVDLVDSDAGWGGGVVGSESQQSLWYLKNPTPTTANLAFSGGGTGIVDGGVVHVIYLGDVDLTAGVGALANTGIIGTDATSLNSLLTCTLDPTTAADALMFAQVSQQGGSLSEPTWGGTVGSQNTIDADSQAGDHIYLRQGQPTGTGQTITFLIAGGNYPSAIAAVVKGAAASSSIPTVTTQAATKIGLTTATGNGNVTSDGGATITERGVCWSISPDPTTSDSKATASGTTGAFTADITGLTPSGTTYHYRAYAINANGTAYGSDQTFVTQTAGTYTDTYNSGSGNWVCPENVSTARVQCWGGGGKGGGRSSSSGACGGAGGGEYAEEPAYSVTPGDSYAYAVGAGDTSAGGTGGASTFATTGVVANGGSSPSNNSATGAAGGTGSTNTIHYDGGAGANGSGTTAGGGGEGGCTNEVGHTASGSTGGTGGDGGDGGNGRTGTTGVGLAGSAPGGGGGGAYRSTSGTTAGGNGAAGRVSITYTISGGGASLTPPLGSAALAGIAPRNDRGLLIPTEVTP